IGKNVALGLAAEGASVVINDFGTGPDGIKLADKAVAEVKEAGGKAAASYDSVTTVVSAAKIMNTATSNFGRVDILVNCAGNIVGTSTLEITQEQWDATLAIHIGGHFACSQAAAREMVKQKSGGSIITFASRGAFPLFASSGSSYAVAKAGILGFTTSLSSELKKYDIRVNAICPNASTPLFPSTDPRGGMGIPKTTSLDPSDIAPLIVYLTTDAAKNITGQFIYAAGGDFCIFDRPLQPKIYVRKIGKWTVDELGEVFPGLGLGQ
ncbi:MAG TPA: SDR family oxidoreductase, partial [Dehalococcoidales bacterium]|nr:SDR family oxidoreductase [Dehalococcoidales bacterium]